MKKILLFVCLALLMGFSSCSSDDDNGDLPQNPSKKLSKIEVYDDNGDLLYIETFSYDNQDRWIKSELELQRWYTNDPEYKPEKRIRTLSYTNNSIKYSDDGYTEIFTLKNNLIVSRHEEGSTDIYNYQYSNGYLTKIGEDYADFEYTNGNLTKSKEYRNYTISYTNIPDKLGINIFEPSFNDGSINVYPDNPLYQFGYYGNRSKNLIESIKSNYSSMDGYSCSYTLDKNGYVTEMEKSRNGGGYETYKFYY